MTITTTSTASLVSERQVRMLHEAEVRRLARSSRGWRPRRNAELTGLATPQNALHPRPA